MSRKSSHKRPASSPRPKTGQTQHDRKSGGAVSGKTKPPVKITGLREGKKGSGSS